MKYTLRVKSIDLHGTPGEGGVGVRGVEECENGGVRPQGNGGGNG